MSQGPEGFLILLAAIVTLWLVWIGTEIDND